ncbi:MAG: hypothetical protein M3R02_10550 [Chloroflexota bacterium]|nr:hypothetical protein [Chloroflexota bacterium]
MNHGKRLTTLEIRYQRLPARPAPPFDPSRLTDDERAELGQIYADMQAVDVGPVPLGRRTETRARLDTLTDDQLARLETLQSKGRKMTA